ncbi:MAG: serine kinase [Cyanobacteria bacterium P01_C01_bin.72]
MFSYFAYGLNICSDLALPEFQAVDLSHCDLKITLDQTVQVSDLLADDLLNKAATIQLSRTKAMVYVRGTGIFIVENGDRVKIIPDGQPPELLLRFYLVGTVLAIALYQRNFLVLHASAVKINGGAVAFLGVSGEGKSSTAAAFVTHGYGLITDDVAPINFATDPCTINPGFPQVKLGAAMAQALGYEYESLHAVHTFKEKRALQPWQGFSLDPVPLKRIYVLHTANELAISPLKASAAVTEIARHSRPTTLYHSGDANHFFQCADLVKRNQVCRLSRPKDFSSIPDLIQLVEQDLSEMSAANSTVVVQ